MVHEACTDDQMIHDSGRKVTVGVRSRQLASCIATDAAFWGTGAVLAGVFILEHVVASSYDTTDALHPAP
jgi:hypothetical protein